MKRNKFIKSILFCFAATFVPKAVQLQPRKSMYIIKDRNTGVTVMGLDLTEAEIADLKLQKEILKLKPRGLAIDMKGIRRILNKRKHE